LRLIEEAAGHSGDRWFASELDRLKGELLLESGERDQAQNYLRRALDTAHGQGARLLELRAAISLARLLQARCCRAEAAALLGPIYNQFDEGLHTADLEQAKALLRQLAESDGVES
jgi:predicted ATPase